MDVNTWTFGWGAVEAISALITAGTAIATVFLLYFQLLFQLRNISHSLEISRQGNAVNVIAHCASRYEAIMKECNELKLSVPEAQENWWYRYWDLQTEQFNFFRKSLLDVEIYELWMNELAGKYKYSPREGMEKRSVSHKDYLRVTLPAYTELQEFFKQLEIISEETDLENRAKAVHNLIMAFSPS